MSYTKQTWQAGDEITSAKLNHLEDGINNIATEVANFPVEVNNPQDGDTLIYNAAEQKWVSGSNNGSDSGGGYLAVHENNNTLDKTWKEIYDALSKGKYVCIAVPDDGTCIQRPITAANSYIYENGSDYTVTASKSMEYETHSENGYPVYLTPGR